MSSTNLLTARLRTGLWKRAWRECMEWTRNEEQTALKDACKARSDLHTWICGAATRRGQLGQWSSFQFVVQHEESTIHVRNK